MKKHTLANATFLFPCLFAFVCVIVIPFFLGIYYSLTDWDGVSKKFLFIGFQNYTHLFEKPDFLHALLITVLYSAINIVLVNMVSFGLSLLVTSKVKLRNFYRAGFFVPNLIGGIVLGYIWQFLFNNAFLYVGDVTGIDFFASSLISRPDTVIWAMSVVNIWQYAGYIMMIFVAAIQGIPASLLEAASVDGAGYWTRLTKITVPMMANAFTISLFLTLVNSFKQFDMNYTLTNGGPSVRYMGKAIKSSQLLALNIYDTATTNHLAEAQARAVVLFVLLVVVALLQVYFNKRKEVEM